MINVSVAREKTIAAMMEGLNDAEAPDDFGSVEMAGSPVAPETTDVTNVAGPPALFWAPAALASGSVAAVPELAALDAVSGFELAF